MREERSLASLPFPGEGTRASRRLTSLRACRVASSRSSSLSQSDSQESGGMDVCRSVLIARNLRSLEEPLESESESKPLSQRN